MQREVRSYFLSCFCIYINRGKESTSGSDGGAAAPPHRHPDRLAHTQGTQNDSGGSHRSALRLPPASTALTSSAVHLLIEMPLHLCWNSRCSPLHPMHTYRALVSEATVRAMRLCPTHRRGLCTRRRGGARGAGRGRAALTSVLKSRQTWKGNCATRRAGHPCVICSPPGAQRPDARGLVRLQTQCGRTGGDERTHDTKNTFSVQSAQTRFPSCFATVRSRATSFS